ncbi:MAG: hypothetical protein D6B25_07200 [Desulfobulbaceae bacterium]|nr:MAG: hypothetical protein D6B25_07200 [Desulfobulbaceae bacterium]
MAEQQITIIDVSEHTVSSIQGLGFDEAFDLRNQRTIDIDDSADNSISVIEESLSGFNRSGSLFVMLGVHHFFFRLLSLPFADIKQLHALIPLELQDRVSFDLEDYYYTPLFHEYDGQETKILMILVKKRFIDELHLLAEKYLFTLETITVTGFPELSGLAQREAQRANGVNQVSLAIDTIHAGIFITGGGSLLFARSARFDEQNLAKSLGSILRTTLQHPQCSKGLNELTHCFALAGNISVQEQWPQIAKHAGIAGVSIIASSSLPARPNRIPVDGNRISPVSSVISRAAGDCFGVNFARRTSATSRKRVWLSEKMRPFAKVAAMVVLGLSVILAGVDYVKLNRFLKGTEKKLSLIYQDLDLPDDDGNQTQWEQLNREVAKLRIIEAAAVGNESGRKAVDMLHEISVRIPADLPVTLVSFGYDRKKIQLQGFTDTFASVDRILSLLERAVYFQSVRIQSANADDLTDTIRFELELEI